MKAIAALLAAASLGVSFLPQKPQPKIKVAPETVLLISGDVNGYLAPCGCTKPMTGGISRRASAVRLLGTKSTVQIDTGRFAPSRGRQDELKAEAVAESLRLSGADLALLDPADARRGLGHVDSLRRLSGGALSEAGVGPQLGLKPPLVKGPFLIAGVILQPSGVASQLNVEPVSPGRALDELRQQSEQRKLVPVVMIDEGLEGAKRLVLERPWLQLVVYRSESDPPLAPTKEGGAWLVTPGERGKNLLRMTWSGGRFTSYKVVRLGPEFPDDPAVSRAYARYLDRVTNEQLLEKLPRTPSAAFAGTKACMSCHSNAARVWKTSKHAEALATLEKVRHDRDPDCVSCHVVALESTVGFRSRSATPQLANVGCESCHGPGKAHAIAPKLQPMPQVGSRSCMTCHAPQNSPAFNFQRYWQKIVHN